MTDAELIDHAVIATLAKIDSREVYTDSESLYCDSDEWLMRRELEWVTHIIPAKKQD